MSSPKTFFTTKKSLGEKSNKILLCQWIKFDFSSVVGGGRLPVGVCVLRGMRGPDVAQRTKWIILHAHLKNNTQSLIKIRTKKYCLRWIHFILDSKASYNKNVYVTSVVRKSVLFWYSTMKRRGSSAVFAATRVAFPTKPRAQHFKACKRKIHLRFHKEYQIPNKKSHHNTQF